MEKFKKIVLAIIISLMLPLLGPEASSAGDELIIGVESFPPYTYSAGYSAGGESVEVTGIDIEVAAHILNTLGVKYRINLTPWARNWQWLKQGQIDASLNVSKTPERIEVLYFPENYVWQSNYIFFTNLKTKAKFEVKSYEDVKKFRLIVGVVRDNSYNEDFWKAFPWQNPGRKLYHKLLEPSVDIETCMKKLSDNRIQIYMHDKKIGLYTAKKLGIDNIVYYDNVFFSKSYYHVFSKASKFKNEKYNNIFQLVKDYDKELEKFKATDKFREIINKYENHITTR